MVSARNASAIRCAKELTETVTLINTCVSFVIEAHILCTACANSGAIFRALFAGEAVARTRLALEGDIVEPLARRTRPIQHALRAIVNHKELGVAGQAHALPVAAWGAVLAESGAGKASFQIGTPSFHGEVGLALEASLIVYAVFATSNAIYIICYIK